MKQIVKLFLVLCLFGISSAQASDFDSAEDQFAALTATATTASDAYQCKRNCNTRLNECKDSCRKSWACEIGPGKGKTCNDCMTSCGSFFPSCVKCCGN